MPEWLAITLGVGGGLNIIGLVVWIVGTIYAVKAEVAALQKDVGVLQSNCAQRRIDVNHATDVLKAEVQHTADVLRTDVNHTADTLKADTKDVFDRVFKILAQLQRVTTALAAKQGLRPDEYRE
jgi:hypothetical protein